MSYKNIKTSDGSYVRYYDNGDIRDSHGNLLGYTKDNGDIVSKDSSLQSGYIKDGIVRNNRGQRIGSVDRYGNYMSDDHSEYSSDK